MSQKKNPEKPADSKQSKRRVKIKDFKISDSESANVTGGRAGRTSLVGSPQPMELADDGYIDPMTAIG